MVAISHYTEGKIQYVNESEILLNAVIGCRESYAEVVSNFEETPSDHYVEYEQKLLEFINKLRPNINKLMKVDNIRKIVLPKNNRMTRSIMEANPNLSENDVYTCSFAFSLFTLWLVNNSD
jgi:hypothetical protein